MRATGSPPEWVAGETPVPDEWVRSLSGGGAEREHATARLHEMLLRVARAEERRCSGQLRSPGPKWKIWRTRPPGPGSRDHQDRQVRGESRFTTWTCKFVIFEVSDKIGRHFWRHPTIPLEAGTGTNVPDRFGLDPARESEWRDLVRALRRAVEDELTEHQRRVSPPSWWTVCRWMRSP